MRFKGLPQPTGANRPEQESEARVVTKHVTHLDGQALAGRIVQHSLEVRQVLPRRLIQMDVFSGGDTAGGSRYQVANRGLHRDQLQPCRIQQLLLGHPRDAPVRRLVLDGGPALVVRFHHTDNFKCVIEFAQRRHFATGVGMLGSDLTGLDTLLAARGCGTGPIRQ